MNEDRAIKQTIAAYVDAFVKGDGHAACDRLTEDARRAVIDAAGRVGAASCPDAFERTRKLGGKQVRAVAKKITVGKVDRNGSSARVTLRAAGVDSIADLQKVGDAWKIASLPKA